MTDPDVTLCVLGSKPHRATVGYVCEQHLQRLADTLRDIEQEAAILSAVPSMAVRSGRGGSLPSHRSPAVLDAIVATDRRRGQVDYSDEWALDDTASVLGTLMYWANRIRIIRKLQPPTQFTVSGERDVLSRNLGWIAGQDWIEDVYAALTGLLGQLRNINGTAAAKPTARCLHCDGPIRVDQDNNLAYCTGQCRTTWAADEVPPLLAKLRDLRTPRTDDGRAMMTVAQIVERFGGNANSVRVRLSRAGVRGVDGYYDTAVFEGVSA